MSVKKNRYLDPSSLAVPPYTNSENEPVQLSQSEKESDPDVDDVWDTRGYIFCGHGREFCQLCGTDHRITNELSRRSWVGGDEATYDDVWDVFDRLSGMECELMSDLHEKRSGNRNLTILTKYSHDLLAEVYGTPTMAERLPPWPPKGKETVFPPGTKVVLRNLKARADLNGKIGTISHLLTEKNRYCVRLPDGVEVSIAVTNVEKCGKSREAEFTTDESTRDGNSKTNSNNNGSNNNNNSTITNISTMADLDVAFGTCREGASIQLSAGRFKPTGRSDIVIPGKSLTIQGSTTGKTVLDCTLKTAKDAKGKLLVLKNLHVLGGFDIEDNEYNDVVVSECHFESCSSRDCVKVGKCDRKCLFRNCVISGGSDGLFHTSSHTDLTIENCAIKNAGSRGIFANSDFVIRDSVVENCGSYGIKCRGGCTVLGECDIQPGPWDMFGTAGGMTRGGDTYGDPDTFADLGGLTAMMARADPTFWQ